jgi:hypothetical protein
MNVLGDLLEENDSVNWTGRQVTYPIHVGRNEGVGASAEGALLPTAGKQSFATVKIPVKYNYVRVQLTKQVMESSMESEGAFARAMDYELKGAVKDAANDLERQNFGYGKGTLALAAGAQSISATTTLNVDSPYGITPTTNGARFLNPGMTVVVMDPSSDTTIEGTFTVSSIGSAGTSIVIGGTQSLTISDNARLFRYIAGDVSGATNNLGHERMGLLGLIDDGTYAATLHNVVRATYPVFTATVIPSVGQLSLDVIQRGVDATDERGGANLSTGGVFLTHHSVRREYLKLLEADRRYTGGDLRSPDGGVKKAALRRGGEITYGDIPWRVAKHAPYGTLFAFEKGSITRYIQIRGAWADDDGSILKWIPEYDKWTAFYRIWDNNHTDRPNDSVRWDGITATVQVYHLY